MCLQPDALTLRTTLEPRGPAAAVILDDAQVAVVGGGAKTPPVRVTVNGHTFRGRIGRMGGESLIGFSRAVREAAGVAPGDVVDVEIALDDQPREVDAAGAAGRGARGRRRRARGVRRPLLHAPEGDRARDRRGQAPGDARQARRRRARRAPLGGRVRGPAGGVACDVTANGGWVGRVGAGVAGAGLV